MDINAQYDLWASELSGKLTFYCDRFELRHEDILHLKEKKLIRWVEPEGLPEMIPCQVLIYCEWYRRATVVLFNPEFALPAECYEEPFLNRELIEWTRKSGGFWIEFSLPMNDDAIWLNLSFSV